MRHGPYDGGQAFPTEGGDMSGVRPHTGMSLREWFAGQALVGLIASYGPTSATFAPEADANMAFEYADAMLARARKERDEYEQAERDGYDATTPIS